MLIMSLDKHQSQQETLHTKKAQALVITLLVLAIISIVVMGIIVVSNRDVTQVVTNEKYDRLYNESEKKLIETIETNGITSLPTSCGTPSVFAGYTQYNCGTTTQSSETLNASVDLKVIDRKSITDYVVKKDRSLDVALNGYSGEVQIRWNKPVAMEFSIVYTDAGGVVRNIRDVYDLAGVYDSLTGDNPNSDAGNIHDISFAVLDSSNTATTTKFIISATNGISLGSTVSLRITPRTKTVGDVVSLNVVATTESSFPFQMREFVVSSIDSQDSSSPIASVVTKIPLAPQVDDIFDYSILVNGNLTQ